jgi:hypothetical protein
MSRKGWFLFDLDALRQAILADRANIRDLWIVVVRRSEASLRTKLREMQKYLQKAQE